MRIDLIEPGQDAELAAFMNRNCDLEDNRFTPELIRQRLWDFPSMLPECRVAAYEADRLVAAVAGGLTGDLGFIRLFAVDPACRRQGLASRLLAQVEESLRHAGAREIAMLYGWPGYFMPGLDPRYTAALCLLEKLGYERADVVANMMVPLNAGRAFSVVADQAERRISQHAVQIRRAEHADRQQVAAWMSQHFAGGWEMEVGLTFVQEPIPLWLAFRNSAVVGFAAYNVALFTGGFGPTGVEEPLQGLGIGAALFLRTLVDMRARGYPECEIAWLGPAGFYSKTAGARINRDFWQMKKKLV